MSWIVQDGVYVLYIAPKAKEMDELLHIIAGSGSFQQDTSMLARPIFTADMHATKILRMHSDFPADDGIENSLQYYLLSCCIS